MEFVVTPAPAHWAVTDPALAVKSGHNLQVAQTTAARDDDGDLFTSDLVPGNQTHPTAFTLLGLSEEASLQPLLFWAFLAMYLVTFTGNLLIILAIVTDPHLHTPMYFFLANLSFADICFTSTTVPKMLLNIQTQNKAITYAGCLSQVFFYIFFGGLDTFLLTAMAYDRFVAICHPLHYMVIMNPQFCGLLLLASWVRAAGT
ncbi:olfactory receptor 7C1-like, partial [Talpa occidentalis]|uniref:olfactory receptor 7C1-like n=1 Tax=Talpa occidentalis TaxID=50954 RepID=UPI0023F7B6AA